MATQIITRLLCDLCAADDNEVEATRQIEVTLDDVTYGIDVCKEHGEPFDQMGDLLDEHARRLPKTKSGRKTITSPNAPNAAETTCPVCGSGPYVNRQGLGTHLRTQHQMSIADALGERAPFRCDVCDQGFTKAAGVVVHRRKAHPDAAPPIPSEIAS